MNSTPEKAREDAPGGDVGRIALMIAVFLVALSVLVFEVALTRAFSVLLRYHFVFLALSLAICGIGLGGFIDYITGPFLLRRGSLATHLALRACLLAVLYPLAIYLLFSTPLSAALTSIWLVSGLCILPFLAAGMLLSRIFAQYSQRGGSLYAADLVGAALGSFLVIGALQLFGATTVPFTAGVAAALAAVALATGAPRATMVVISALVLLAVGLGMIGNIKNRYIDLPVMTAETDALAKPLFRELGDPRINARIVYTEWNAFARTDVVREAGPDGIEHPHDDYYIYTDGEVPTNMLWFQGDLREIEPRLRGFIGFLPFHWFQPDEVLLIGPGGGLDVLLAQAVGARNITGVELNPSMPRIVRKYGEFNGHVYDQQNVNVVVDEGRSFVQRSRDRYDIIYMALTKTATTASSSLALVESYIHTREAFSDYLNHLTDDGVIVVVMQEPWLMLRLFLTALEALEETGMERSEALRCLSGLSVPRRFYVAGPYRHVLMVTRHPLPVEMSEQLARETIAVGLEPAFFPGAFEPVPFSWLTREGATTEEFVNAWNQWKFGEKVINIEPCTDDRPFVVDMTYGVPGQFKALLWGSLVLAFLFSIGAIIHQRACPIQQLPMHILPGTVLYFTALGIGFMLVEICMIQKLVLYLGYPVLTLSVILFALLLSGGLGSFYSQRFPVTSARALAAAAAGVVVIYGSLLQYVEPQIITATLGWDIRLRCLITVLMLAPLGFAMGIPFPTGLRAVGLQATRLVPWMWGVNGLTSVAGSVGAMVLAKLWGFNTVLQMGWAMYIVAAALPLSGVALLARRTATGEAASADGDRETGRDETTTEAPDTKTDDSEE